MQSTRNYAGSGDGLITAPDQAIDIMDFEAVAKKELPPIFKALALGANAVGVGRPYLRGLASFEQPGVETVLEILRSELEMVMRQMGATSIGGIPRSSATRASDWLRPAATGYPR